MDALLLTIHRLQKTEDDLSELFDHFTTMYQDLKWQVREKRVIERTQKLLQDELDKNKLDLKLKVYGFGPGKNGGIAL